MIQSWQSLALKQQYKFALTCEQWLNLYCGFTNQCSLQYLMRLTKPLALSIFTNSCYGLVFCLIFVLINAKLYSRYIYPYSGTFKVNSFELKTPQYITIKYHLLEPPVAVGPELANGSPPRSPNKSNADDDLGCPGAGCVVGGC